MLSTISDNVGHKRNHSGSEDGMASNSGGYGSVRERR